jgi:hypothetical protein
MQVDKRIIKNWIQYLKNSQIVSMKSDPSGKLDYRRPVRVEDLLHFLRSSTNFDEQKITSAIETVLKNKISSSTELSTTSNQQTNNTDDIQDVEPKDVNPQDVKQISAPTPAQLPAPTQNTQAPDSEEDELSQTPDAIRKRQRRAEIANQKKMGKQAFSQMAGHLKSRNLKEEITDEQGATLSEKDVEEILNLLSSQQEPEQEPKKEPTADPEKEKLKKEEDVRKLKRTIRDVMTPEQRKQLWRALNEVVQESQVTSADAKAVFKAAAEYKNNGISSFWKKTPKVSFEDLMQAWKDAGYPDDTRDLEYILKKRFSFEDSDINKVFQQVFGADKNGYASPGNSEAVMKIVNYIKKNNLQSEIISFMQDEFADEIQPKQKPNWFGRKTTNEEIKDLFLLLSEGLNKQSEFKHLGRNKKDK